MSADRREHRRDHRGEYLRVEGIEFEATIGVTQRERRRKRRLSVNLELVADFTRVKASDAIRDTVDYRRATELVIEAGERSTFRLIEALAGHLGQTLLDAFPRLREVRVEVWKPGALRQAGSVGVAVVAARAGG